MKTIKEIRKENDEWDEKMEKLKGEKPQEEKVNLPNGGTIYYDYHQNELVVHVSGDRSGYLRINIKDAQDIANYINSLDIGKIEKEIGDML